MSTSSLKRSQTVGQHRAGLFPHLRLAKQLDFGKDFRPRTLGILFGQLLDKCPGLGHLALFGKQRCAPLLYFERALRVVDSRQPGLGRLELAALFGRLRKHQKGLHPRLIVVGNGIVALAVVIVVIDFEFG